MRIAVVSDIHGNLTAFDAVVADLRETAPDVILHGGDLADSGSAPAEVVDRIRALGWAGILGNTDEMLTTPDTLSRFADQPLFGVLNEMAAATRDLLGEERLTWMRSLPLIQLHEHLALVHASPESLWRAPMPEADDDALESVYNSLQKPVVIYGHIHRSYVRNLPRLTVANTGSVSLSHDGDRRAAYLLVDDGVPAIRRVEYDVLREIRALTARGLPRAEWIAKMLATASPCMPF